MRVAPGADPGQIRLSLSRAEAVRLNDSGDLVLDFSGGTLTQPLTAMESEAKAARLR